MLRNHLRVLNRWTSELTSQFDLDFGANKGIVAQTLSTKRKTHRAPLAYTNQIQCTYLKRERFQERGRLFFSFMVRRGNACIICWRSYMISADFYVVRTRSALRKARESAPIFDKCSPIKVTVSSLKPPPLCLTSS